MQSGDDHDDGAGQRSPKRARADASQQMGALLLRGWTMRAESCPDCMVHPAAHRHLQCVPSGVWLPQNKRRLQVPLMSLAQAPDWLCVNCSTSFQPGGEGLVPRQAAEYLPSPGTPDKAGLLGARLAAGPAESRSGALAAEEDAALTAAGQQPVGAGPAAPGSEAGDTLSLADEAAFAHAEDLRAALRRAGRPAAVPVRDSADALAERVLQGWVLTNDHCPR